MSTEELVKSGASTEVALESPGEELANSVIDGIDTDMRLAVRRRGVRAATDRLRAIKEDLVRLVADLQNNYSDAEETLVRIYIEGVRPELLKCFLTVNPNMALDAAGRSKLTGLVDKLIDDTLARLTSIKASTQASIQASIQAAAQPEVPEPAKTDKAERSRRGKS